MSEVKNELINHAQINWSDQSEPISTLFNDVYFNTEQGIDESFYVFFQGNKLPERWLTCENEYFSIAETGFGSGLNFLICALHFQQFLTQHPEKPLKRLFFTSFEKYPLKKADLDRALHRWPSLKKFSCELTRQYPLALPGCHRLFFESCNITLDLWFGDIQQSLPRLYSPEQGLFDCWFLDGFAPSRNPEMWSEELFKRIVNSCKKSATIATFTAAGFVRRGLISAGFTIEKRKGYGKKREMLIGKLATQEKLKKTTAPHAENVNIKEVAIVGDTIASACLSLALVRRGYNVTLYCQGLTVSDNSSKNINTVLYPYINEGYDSLNQMYANSFLYTRNYIEQINQSNPLDFDFSNGLQHSESPAILQENLPNDLVQSVTDRIGVFYPLGGWLNPKQMILAIVDKASASGILTVKFNHFLRSLNKTQTGWQLQFAKQKTTHSRVILTKPSDLFSSIQCKPTDTPPPTESQNRLYFPFVGALEKRITAHLNNIKQPSIDNHLYLLTGLGSHEFCLAPLLAEMLASQINKEPIPFPIMIIDKMISDKTWINIINKPITANNSR